MPGCRTHAFNTRAHGARRGAAARRPPARDCASNSMTVLRGEVNYRSTHQTAVPEPRPETSAANVSQGYLGRRGRINRDGFGHGRRVDGWLGSPDHKRDLLDVIHVYSLHALLAHAFDQHCVGASL